MFQIVCAGIGVAGAVLIYVGVWLIVRSRKGPADLRARRQLGAMRLSQVGAALTSGFMGSVAMAFFADYVVAVAIMSVTAAVGFVFYGRLAREQKINMSV